jgi:hypothetical protein
MSSLKENLASQNLNLGRIDVTVAHAAGNTADAGSGHSQQQNMGQNPGAFDFGQAMGQNANQSNQQRAGAWEGASEAAGTRGVSGTRSASLREASAYAGDLGGGYGTRNRAENGRLDITA